MTKYLNNNREGVDILVNLPAWKLRTLSQIFFNDFRQRFHNIMITPNL